MLEFRNFSGAAGEYPLPSRGQEQDRIPAHVEWQRLSGRTHLGCHLENYQQADGSVRIPEALQPYMGTDCIPARISAK